MDIKKLIAHQFNEIVSSSPKETPSEYTMFRPFCLRIKQLLEAADLRTADIVSTTMLLRRFVRWDIQDTSFVDQMVAEKFAERGILLESLAESAAVAQAIPAGEYVVRGRACVWEEDLLPIDECFGHPVYEANGLYFILSEAKKKVGEDAPVNSVGGGMIAGVSPGQEPPGPKGGFKARMMMKRKKKSPQIDRMDGWPK